MGVFVSVKNVLFLQYFYARLILIIIVIFRVLFDFILFCRYQINVEQCEKKMKNSENEDFGQLDSNPTRIAGLKLFFDPKEKKKKINKRKT